MLAQHQRNHCGYDWRGKARSAEVDVAAAAFGGEYGFAVRGEFNGGRAGVAEVVGVAFPAEVDTDARGYLRRKAKVVHKGYVALCGNDDLTISVRLFAEFVEVVFVFADAIQAHVDYPCAAPQGQSHGFNQ